MKNKFDNQDNVSMLGMTIQQVIRKIFRWRILLLSRWLTLWQSRTVWMLQRIRSDAAITAGRRWTNILMRWEQEAEPDMRHGWLISFPVRRFMKNWNWVWRYGGRLSIKRRITSCSSGKRLLEFDSWTCYNPHLSGCGPAWSGRLTGGQEAVSSNLTTPMIRTGNCVFPVLFLSIFL